MSNLLPGESLRDWIQIGARVTWLKQLRGGYGGVVSIPAVVTAITDHRVRIAFIEERPTLGATLRRRSVRPYSLRERDRVHDIDQPHWSCHP